MKFHQIYPDKNKTTLALGAGGRLFLCFVLVLVATQIEVQKDPLTGWVHEPLQRWVLMPSRTGGL